MIDATGFVAARDQGERVEVGVAKGNVDLEATMRADLDLLCISVFCTARTTCFLPGSATAAAN